MPVDHYALLPAVLGADDAHEDYAPTVGYTNAIHGRAVHSMTVQGMTGYDMACTSTWG